MQVVFLPDHVYFAVQQEAAKDNKKTDEWVAEVIYQTVKERVYHDSYKEYDL